MNQVELQKSSEGYSIATVGDIASFEGKAFVKDILNTTSMEVSFGTLATVLYIAPSLSFLLKNFNV